MNKKAIVQALVEVFMKKLSELGGAMESNQRLARDAPGANTSHSDTSKFAHGNVALGLSGSKIEIGESIASLRDLPVDQTFDSCLPGALALFSDATNGERYYLFVLKGGGETVVVDGKEVTSLSVAAPLARACRNKRVDDEVTYNGKTYCISSIW